MSVTRVICEGCGFAMAWCTCTPAQIKKRNSEMRKKIARHLLYDVPNKETYQSGPYQLTRKKGKNP